MLAQMFSENSSLKPDVDNSYFIDRDSTYFRLVLNYLRDLKVNKTFLWCVYFYLNMI